MIVEDQLWLNSLDYLRYHIQIWSGVHPASFLSDEYRRFPLDVKLKAA